MVSVYPSQSFCKAANQTYSEHVWGYIMLQYVTKGVPRWFSVVLGFTYPIWPSSIPRCLQQILVLAAFVAAPGYKSRAAKCCKTPGRSLQKVGSGHLSISKPSTSPRMDSSISAYYGFDCSSWGISGIWKKGSKSKQNLSLTDLLCIPD